MSKSSSTLPIVIIFFGVLILIYQNFTSYVKNSDNKVIQPVVTDKELLILKRPKTGYFKNYTNQDLVAPFSITAPSDKNVLVKMVHPQSTQTVMSVFVRKNETAKVKAPLGEYVIKYAIGDKWYGFNKLFGNETIYLKSDVKLDFTYSNNGYRGNKILFNVYGGNLHSYNISAEDF